jgi:hypothetical protein
MFCDTFQTNVSPFRGPNESCWDVLCPVGENHYIEGACGKALAFFQISFVNEHPPIHLCKSPFGKSRMVVAGEHSLEHLSGVYVEILVMRP